jgi:F-type H+-transporting ATPase subunit epsilon
MATSFQLRIVTPRSQILDEEVREVTAPGTLGELGVLPDHVTFLTSLEPGVLIYKSDRATSKVAIRSGFAEVLDNVMTVLVDDAAFGRDIDAEAARRDLQHAEHALQSLEPSNEGYASAEAARRWAVARIDASR